MNNITQQPNGAYVDQFILSRTAPHLDQYRRPLTTTVDTEIIAAFSDATHEGAAITSSTISDISGNVIRPSADVHGEAGIINGWREERARFCLTVKQGGIWEGSSTCYIFHGYTDRYEPSYSGALPDDTRLYFDKVTSYRRITRNVNGEMVGCWVNNGSNQILRGYSEEERQTGLSAELVTIRPEDIYGYHMTRATHDQSRINNGIMGNVVATYGYDGSRINNIDPGCRFKRGSELKLSRGSGLSAPNYLSKTMSGMRIASRSPDANAHDEAETYGAAMSAVRNNVISSNAFLFGLRNNTGLLEHGYITLEELFFLHPEAKGNYLPPDPNAIINTGLQADDTCGWGGKDQNSVATEMVAQTAPSIALECDFQMLAFTVHSLGNRQFSIIPNENYMRTLMDGLDVVECFNRFADRLITELLLPLTFGDRLSVDLSVAIDVTSSTSIELSLDGDQPVPYLRPTYCSASNSYLLDIDDGNVAAVANDIDHLIREVTGIEPAGSDAGNFERDFMSGITSNYDPAAEPWFE